MGSNLPHAGFWIPAVPDDAWQLKPVAVTALRELVLQQLTSTRGTCQTQRKSYKTSCFVGWIVGWKSQRHHN